MCAAVTVPSRPLNVVGDAHREEIEIDRYDGVADRGGAVGRRLGGAGEIGRVTEMVGDGPSGALCHSAQRRESGAISSEWCRSK